ncbi:MAG: hypothetical protein ILO36_02615 [Abditibacteriota bacterium]|nr:hypothetical protein [Abditibacteriota bacterium]
MTDEKKKFDEEFPYTEEEEREALNEIGKRFNVYESCVSVINERLGVTVRGFMVPEEECPDIERLKEGFTPLRRLEERRPGAGLAYDRLLGAWFVYPLDDANDSEEMKGEM